MPKLRKDVKEYDDFLLLDIEEYSKLCEIVLRGLIYGYTQARATRSFPLPGNESMVQNQSNSDIGNQPPDHVVLQLAVIAKNLESIDALQKDVAALKSQSQNRDISSNGSRKKNEGDSSWRHQRYRPHNKIAFPTFSDGDPRGWILKAAS
ncbi:hypothetical protein Tco_0581242 [Tanacetum coccineum]